MSGRGRILVVDDDRDMVRTLGDVLRIHGWEVATAHSGEEAVRQVRDHSFTVVVMDIKMSGMDGVAALRRMREIRPLTRVILMTAYSTLALIEEAIGAGVIEVLSKPVVLPNLLDRVSQAAQEPRPILVVDDDPDFLMTLCQDLEKSGLRTHAARNLTEALAHLEEDTIPVVLLDLRLEGVSGTDTVLAIKEASPAVLFVLFTGHPGMLDEVEADVPHGWIVASLLKPFDPARLIAILERTDGAQD